MKVEALVKSRSEGEVRKKVEMEGWVKKRKLKLRCGADTQGAGPLPSPLL